MVVGSIDVGGVVIFVFFIIMRMFGYLRCGRLVLMCWFVDVIEMWVGVVEVGGVIVLVVMWSLIWYVVGVVIGVDIGVIGVLMVFRGWYDRVCLVLGSVKELGCVVVWVVRGEFVGVGWFIYWGELVEG